MAYTDFLTPVAAGDNDFVKWAKLQAQIKAACINAGISIPMSTLLDDIRTGDTELQKFQKVNAWLKLLAQNITGGGGGSSVKAGNPAVTTGTSNLAVAFSVAFGAAPSVLCQLVPTGGGDPILVDPTSITASGFTAQWGFAIPAGYSLVWVATATTQ